MKHKHKWSSYDDILNLPHPESSKHPRMSRINRAAQFSPFSALTGYSDALQETERLTSHKRVLSEEEQEKLDRKFKMLKVKIAQHPVITVEYYKTDEKKEGGAYQKVTGSAEKILEDNRLLIMQGDRVIPLDDICDFYGEIFDKM